MLANSAQSQWFRKHEKNTMHPNSPSTKHYLDTFRILKTIALSSGPPTHFATHLGPHKSELGTYSVPQPLAPSSSCSSWSTKMLLCLNSLCAIRTLNVFTADASSTQQNKGRREGSRNRKIGRERARVGGGLGQLQSKGMFQVWLPSERAVITLIFSQTSKSPLFISQKQKSPNPVTYQPCTYTRSQRQ